MKKVKFTSKSSILLKKISMLEKDLQDMKIMFSEKRRMDKGNEQVK